MSLIESLGNRFGFVRRLAEGALRPELVELRATQAMYDMYDSKQRSLQEGLAELDLSVDNIGWRDMMTPGVRDFNPEMRKRMNLLARIFFLKNPLINRAVTIKSFYVFARGVQVNSKNKDVNAVVQAFLDDPLNKIELTGEQARTNKEQDLQNFGNLFFVFFVDKMSTGRVTVRTVPIDEVIDIITDPNDSKVAWFYKRMWSQRNIDYASGTLRIEQMTAYYPDIGYAPKDGKPATIGGETIHWDTPIYHVKVGGMSDMKFGVPETWQAIDWARAYKEFLEDWASVVRAYARWAWKMKVAGGMRGVQAAKKRFQTTFASGAPPLTTGIDTNPPPVTASMFIGSEGADLEPVKTSGMTTRAEDGRRLMLMVCAAVGLPETFFGDVSTGNLATAKSLDRPTELMIVNRQKLWVDVLKTIMGVVVYWAATAPNGPLKGLLASETNGTGTDLLDLKLDDDGDPTTDTVDVAFPPILEHDIKEVLTAIVAGGTLNGYAPAGTMDMRTLSRLVLTALEVEDVDELLNAMYPDDETPMPPTPEPNAGAGDPNRDDADIDRAKSNKKSSKEEKLKESVDALRGAIIRLVEKERS